MRKNRVGANADNFRVDFFELVIVVPTGRQFLNSGSSKIEDVKLDQDVLHALKAAQLELASLRTGQFEVRGFVSDLNGRCRWNP